MMIIKSLVKYRDYGDIYHNWGGYFDSNGNVVGTNEDMRYRQGSYQEVKWDKDITIPNDVRRYRGIDVETMYLLHNMKELKYPIIKDIIRKGPYG